MEQIKSNLMLRSCDILPGGPGSAPVATVGTSEQGGALNTWYMNWKALLGNNYEKYEVFAIRMNVFYSPNTTFSSAATPQNQTASIQLSGLNWVNNGYRSSTQSNTGRCPLAIGNLPTGSNSITTYPENTAIAFFSRPGMYDPITIGLYQLTSDSFITFSTGAGIPVFSCLFDVFPVY